jgi:hypothetical protein
MATKWDKFYPYVQPYVPGCPEVVIKAHIQEAAAEFCAKSEVWRFNIEPSYTSKNTADYEVDVPNRAILENIIYLKLDGATITPVAERYYAPTTNANGTLPTGTPARYSLLEDTSIRFYPTPATKHTFTGVAVIKPSLSATGVEDFIFESHGRSIATGAIARIAGIPNKEWSNPEVAISSQIKFERAMCAAKGRDTRRVNMRVRPVSF